MFFKGEEDVFLTTKEIDGYPGKLKEVNDNSVYLHNSEKLFNKYPEIRYVNIFCIKQSVFNIDMIVIYFNMNV